MRPTFTEISQLVSNYESGEISLEDCVINLIKIRNDLTSRSHDFKNEHHHLWDQCLNFLIAQDHLWLHFVLSRHPNNENVNIEHIKDIKKEALFLKSRLSSTAIDIPNYPLLSGFYHPVVIRYLIPQRNIQQEITNSETQEGSQKKNKKIESDLNYIINCCNEFLKAEKSSKLRCSL